ncbi:MAG: c-type cytochrome biogenesis protein CcmI [Alphaproteobacteria bacterium]|nr:c-type cytochrome biogenesis protein CcmI [Alphaproteobacteria bacterium]
MILWVAFAIAAAAVIAAVARPMLATRVSSVDPQQADLAIYRDQLAEIDADLDRGLINPLEAESARVELARRLLKTTDASRQTGKASENDQDAATPSGPITPTQIAYATAAVIPLLTLAIYLNVGSPNLPGMPLSARMQTDPGKASVEQLIAKVEAQLRETPQDGRGWDAIAPVYLRIRRFKDAANAFSQAIRLEGETPKRLRGFAEATVMANNGIVAEPAKKAYARILSLQPGDSESRFWLALADEQEGKITAAGAAYRSLLAQAPDDAPWKRIVESRLKAMEGDSGDASNKVSQPQTEKQLSQPKLPGPTQQDIAAAQKLSKADQKAFINSMVDRLAGKLKDDPQDFEGWLRLVRAYTVLGRKEDASKALATARKNVDNDTTKQARLDALANELGLGT